MIKKNKLIIIALIFLFYSCKNKKTTNEIEIVLTKYSIYLKSSSDSDSDLPPYYDIAFDLKNNSEQDLVFISQANKYDKTKSSLYLLDTLQNTIIPIYSGSRSIVKHNSSCEIDASINIRDYKKYFNLKDTFFNKFDYTSDKLLLDKIFLDMMNRSVIFYKQDSSDVEQYKMLNKNVIPLKKDKIIKIRKDCLLYKPQ
ncbi:hypothetical protein [Flavobacterium sp. S87F.05.LMB.W.Kidney.N]|uniref:hypothetical protein n=1 Tax=Flavobacterium sp. S87F.05.LMB.W.Kidney.N TaxID=1278758 RepID=UPI001065F1F6|nr:hypothetical protein [Flavobacterium sp. S87F.05.LMB.W.Kidney.N]TDX13998.1 hypothetical protein EDB96_0715 [Flavobacterium sp. S87F.05.LMB.W.Kidney.N]